MNANNLAELLASIEARFVSANEVPVERIHIKLREWEQLRDAILNKGSKK